MAEPPRLWLTSGCCLQRSPTASVLRPVVWKKTLNVIILLVLVMYLTKVRVVDMQEISTFCENHTCLCGGCGYWPRHKLDLLERQTQRSGYPLPEALAHCNSGAATCRNEPTALSHHPMAQAQAHHKCKTSCFCNPK